MTDPAEIDFFHSPNSRSHGIRILLEEMGLPYRLHALSLEAGEQRKPEYLAINPMGKVPAIRHDGALVTEQVAVYLYLADRFPQAGLAPTPSDALRGPYLRWMVYYASCFEPAVVDRYMKHAPAPPSSCPYGDFDTMLGTLTDQLERGPHVLGERFSAADVLWGSALNWTTTFGIVPKLPVIERYIERLSARPAFQRAQSLDERLTAELKARTAS